MNSEIIRMAREAGICTWLKPPEDVKERLERFAALVAAAEREACAKVCDELHYAADAYGAQCAEAIRARGQA
jgi:hypothetical protein